MRLMEQQEVQIEEELNTVTAAGSVPKNFRQQADMEAFYRFVHENDLRIEALAILDDVRMQRASIKAKKVKH